MQSLLTSGARSAAYFLVIVILSITAGCGGGGGQPVAGSRLEYTTEWTRAAFVDGQSQRVSILDLNNKLVQSLVVNKSSNQKLIFNPVVAGTYRLSAQLYSLPNLGGIKTGELDMLVTINGTTQVVTVVGDDAESIRVTPVSATFKVQNSRQFFATAYTATNKPTFVAPGSLTWQVLGGVATVNGSGLVLGTSEGSGFVRATHTPTGLFGSAALTVEPFVTTTTKWTILVFINAANDLYTFSTLNMNQMEQVASNSQVRFVVQWKQAFIPGVSENPTFIGTRRYLVKPDNTPAIASELIQDMGTDVDMGVPSTLHDFVNWGKTYFPGTRTCLVIWNHGNGWLDRARADTTRGVSYDDETGNFIKTSQLGQALGSNQFDILAWDASLMQMIEVAYEVKDQVAYVAGSEESPPGEGYPYHRIFDNFRDAPDDPTSALSKAFVDGMLEEPNYVNRKITQSVIDTSKLSALATAVDALADALIANRSSLLTAVPSARNTSKSYSQSGYRYFRDLYDLCEKLEIQTSIPAVVAATTNVKLAVNDAVIWEGHNAHSAGSRGISIDFSPSSTFSILATDYAALRFGQDTSWDEWLAVAP